MGRTNSIGKFSKSKCPSQNMTTTLTSNSTLKVLADMEGQVNNRGKII